MHSRKFLFSLFFGLDPRGFWLTNCLAEALLKLSFSLSWLCPCLPRFLQSFGVFSKFLFSHSGLSHTNFGAMAVSAGTQGPGITAWNAMAAAPLAPPFVPPLVFTCEACLRSQDWLRFPSSVRNSIGHHALFPGTHPRRTKWTCKECRADEVKKKEQLDKFCNFRHIPEE